MYRKTLSSAIAFALTFVMVLAAAPFKSIVHAAEDFEKIVLTIDSEDVVIDGATSKLDPANPGTAPVSMNNYTMLPLACIADIIGVTTQWDEDLRKVTIISGADTVEMTIGSVTAVVNGRNETMDTAPALVNSRTMLPVSAVAKFLGLDIAWNGTNREVTITKGANQTASASQAATGEVTVTDQTGRTVTFNSNPKVASCYYISTLISLVIGGADSLVGIENQSAHQPIYAAYGDINELPQIGSGRGVNFEELAASGAEVIIIPSRLQESIPQLEQIGVQAIVVVPETLEGLIECFEILGKVYNQEAKAKEVIDYYNNIIDEIEGSVLLRSTNAPKVYVAGNSSFLNTAGANMYQSTIVELAGGVNVAKDLTSSNWEQISVEQLQLFAPEIIFIANGAEYTADDLYNNPQLKGIPAVDNKQVFVFPSSQDAWDVPSASSILGIMWAANKINPDVYPETKLKLEVESFYETFYKTDASYEEVIGQ